MIVYAILGLLLVAVIVFAVMSRKDWHWLNLVLLVFVFMAGAAGMVAMAQTLHLRKTAVKKYNDALVKRVDLEKRANEAVYGSPNSPEYGPDSLRGVTQQVKLMRIGRGRVFSGGTVSNVDGNIRFEFPAELPDTDDEALTLQDVELFAFADEERDGVKFPVGFVGRFLVVEQQPQFLLLERTGLLANFQAYSDPSATTWTLYERMPFDRHGIFRDAFGVADVKEEDFNISEFRNALANELPAQRFGLDPAGAEYERILDEYCFDGLSLGKIENWVESQAATRVVKRFEPKLDEQFVTYRFEKTSNPYEVDDTSGKLDTDGTFTILGLAVDPTLHLPDNKAVVFKKDDTVNIDLRTAQGYQRPDDTVVQPFSNRETVQEVGRFYRRKLTDYPFEMSNIYNRSENAADEADRVIQNNDVQELAVNDAQTQQQERTRLQAAIEKDNGMLQQDLDVVEKARQSLEEIKRENDRQLDSLRQQMNELKSRSNAVPRP